MEQSTQIEYLFMTDNFLDESKKILVSNGSTGERLEEKLEIIRQNIDDNNPMSMDLDYNGTTYVLCEKTGDLELDVFLHNYHNLTTILEFGLEDENEVTGLLKSFIKCDKKPEVAFYMTVLSMSSGKTSKDIKDFFKFSSKVSNYLSSRDEDFSQKNYLEAESLIFDIISGTYESSPDYSDRKLN
jgi:hypothetical protein